jgi:DNA-binding transcriptional MerR regulator
MASLDWQLTHRNDITLVELYVTSDTDEQVRIESNLEPVWPPRRQGVPVAGWDDTGFEGTVEADRPLVVGYASPTEPEEPPATLVDPYEDGGEPTAREVVRTLGDASPPRDVVPTPDGEIDGYPDDETRQCGERGLEDHNHADREWFADVEDRIERAERLSGVSEVDEAREAVTEAGGLDEVRALATQLDSDRRRLEHCRQRTAMLQERLDSVEVPLATLERVT